MIDVDEALRILTLETGALDVVEVALERSSGLVLAEAVVADRDFPPTDRSAMDGFALRAGDVSADGGGLRILGELRAGQADPGIVVEPGTAVRIMTGAIVPRGADAVVMVERVEEDRGRGVVTVRDHPTPGQNVRRRGEDRLRGEPVLEAGILLRAPELAALAAVGRTRISVHRPPTVALLSTGDEVVEPDSVPAEYQVRNSNAVGLAAQARELGIELRYLGIARDEDADLRQALERGSHSDVLLVTGGVSAGEHDLVKDVLVSLGARVLFHHVAMKPGKPVLAARLGGSLVFGLPGNPLSTFTVFAVLVAPVLRRLMGRRLGRPPEWTARLEAEVYGTESRHAYHLATFRSGKDALLAQPVRSTGSGDVLSLVRADGFVITEPGRRVHACGEQVAILPWRGFEERS